MSSISSLWCFGEKKLGEGEGKGEDLLWTGDLTPDKFHLETRGKDELLNLFQFRRGINANSIGVEDASH